MRVAGHTARQATALNLIAVFLPSAGQHRASAAVLLSIGKVGDNLSCFNGHDQCSREGYHEGNGRRSAHRFELGHEEQMLKLIVSRVA